MCLPHNPQLPLNPDQRLYLPVQIQFPFQKKTAFGYYGLQLVKVSSASALNPEAALVGLLSLELLVSNTLFSALKRTSAYPNSNQFSENSQAHHNSRYIPAHSHRDPQLIRR